MRTAHAVVWHVVLASCALGAETHAGVDLVSSYVFRGVTYNDGPCLQPSLEVCGEALCLGVWANFDLSDYDSVRAGDFSEVDLSLSYALTAGPADLSVGITQFLFPEAGPETNTRELFLSAQLHVWAGLTAKGYLGYDVDVADDLYASAEVGWEGLWRRLTLGLGLRAGYAGSGVAAGRVAGLHEFEGWGQVGASLGAGVKVTGFVLTTGSLDEEALPSEEQDVRVVGGVKLSWPL